MAQPCIGAGGDCGPGGAQVVSSGDAPALAAGQVLAYSDISLLGRGTFGLVAACRAETGRSVALKMVPLAECDVRSGVVEIVMREREAMEQAQGSEDGRRHVVRCEKSFLHRDARRALGGSSATAHADEVTRWSEEQSAAVRRKAKSISPNWMHILAFQMELASGSVRSHLKMWGQDLRSAARAHAPPNVPLRWTEHMLRGLAALHGVGLAHRDVKPDNLLVYLDGASAPVVKVADLGMCNVVSTMRTAIVCTLWYRPPEVLRGHAYTERVDVWSAGCVCAELFVGRPLFCASTDESMIRAIEDFVPRLTSSGGAPAPAASREPVERALGGDDAGARAGDEAPGDDLREWRARFGNVGASVCPLGLWLLDKLLRPAPGERLAAASAARVLTDARLQVVRRVRARASPKRGSVGPASSAIPADAAKREGAMEVAAAEAGPRRRPKFRKLTVQSSSCDAAPAASLGGVLSPAPANLPPEPGDVGNSNGCARAGRGLSAPCGVSAGQSRQGSIALPPPPPSGRVGAARATEPRKRFRLRTKTKAPRNFGTRLAHIARSLRAGGPVASPRPGEATPLAAPPDAAQTLGAQDKCACSGNCKSLGHSGWRWKACANPAIACVVTRLGTPTSKRLCAECLCTRCRQKPRHMGPLCCGCKPDSHTPRAGRHGSEHGPPPAAPPRGGRGSEREGIAKRPAGSAKKRPAGGGPSHGKTAMRCVALAAHLAPKMMPCDVQAYFRAASGVRRLDVDLAVLSWKEPWAVADVGSRVRAAMARAPSNRRPYPLLCDAVVAFLRARDGICDKTLPKHVKEQRRILSRQRGLAHMGFIATGVNCGFLRRLKAAGASTPGRFRAAKCQKVVTYFGKRFAVQARPDAFASSCKAAAEFAALRDYPACTKTPKDLLNFVQALAQGLRRFWRGMGKYGGPHGARKVWLRIAHESSDAADAPSRNCDWEEFWANATLKDFEGAFPDQKQCLGHFGAGEKISEVARRHGVHPMMLSCWGCLMLDAINAFGANACLQFFGNVEASASVLEEMLAEFGADTPPCFYTMMARHLKQGRS